MYKLYTDKQEIFECDIQLEGASLNNSKARLVIETTDLSLLFKGDITSEGKCKIPVKRLKGLLGENSKGTIKLEVIAEDTYFIPWESSFEVDTAKKIYEAILDDEISNGMPRDVIEKGKKSFDERLQKIDWKTHFKSLPFNDSALSLYDWAPIAEELKVLDRKIVLNSMILKWDNIKEEFIKLIKF